MIGRICTPSSSATLTPASAGSPSGVWSRMSARPANGVRKASFRDPDGNEIGFLTADSRGAPNRSALARTVRHHRPGLGRRRLRGRLVTWVKQTLALTVEVVKRTDDNKGFKVVPRRWVVERTFAWLFNSRRLVHDYERLPTNVLG